MTLQLLWAFALHAVLASAAPSPHFFDERQGIAPKRQEMPSNHPFPGVKRVKIRSGPYNVPNMTFELPSGAHGMLWNWGDTSVDKPCSGSCTILRQWAGLEYPNGDNANIDTGMWLVERWITRTKSIDRLLGFITWFTLSLVLSDGILFASNKRLFLTFGCLRKLPLLNDSSLLVTKEVSLTTTRAGKICLEGQGSISDLKIDSCMCSTL